MTWGSGDKILCSLVMSLQKCHSGVERCHGFSRCVVRTQSVVHIKVPGHEVPGPLVDRVRVLVVDSCCIVQSENGYGGTAYVPKRVHVGLVRD